MDLTTRRARRLSDVGDLASVRRAPQGLAPHRVESVRIEPRFRTVSPGQAMDLRAKVADAGGHAVLPAAARLRWSSSDTAVVRVSADGKARVVGRGETELVASAGGWRADTLRVTSGDLARTSAPLLLTEDWSRGIDTARWVAFGDPDPTVVSGSGPSGHAFLNDGDANYDSGVLTRRALSLSRGLTLEWWASLPMTGHLYQTFRIGLSTSPLPIPDDLHPPDMDVLDFSADARPAVTYVQSQRGSGKRVLLSLPARRAAWHRYVLELRPDGSVLYLVDGRLRWRSAPGFVDPLPKEARIRLSGRSLGARILAGPLRVWQGLRWALPRATTEGRLARR